MPTVLAVENNPPADMRRYHRSEFNLTVSIKISSANWIEPTMWPADWIRLGYLNKCAIPQSKDRQRSAPIQIRFDDNHSHGEWLVKERINSLCAWYSSAVMGSKSEPLSATRPFAEPVKLTSGRRSHRLHQHPAFGGGGSGGRGHSSTRLFQPNGCPVRPPESGEADQAPRNRIRDIANY